MSRFAELLERFQDGEETSPDLQEFSELLREEPSRGRQLYDAMMLEADLYESYAGIAQIRSAPKAARRWFTSRMVIAGAIAGFVLIGLAILFYVGRSSREENPPSTPKFPVPEPAPKPKSSDSSVPDPKPIPEHDEHHGSERDEAQHEYEKKMKESQRLRERGKTKEADEKEREAIRERDKKLREHDRERRRDDR